MSVIIATIYELHLGIVLSYLGMIGRFHGDDPPVVLDFRSDWVPI